MVPVTVSFTHAQLDVLEDLAAAHGCSVSAVVRDLIARGITIADATGEQEVGVERAVDRSTHVAASRG